MNPQLDEVRWQPAGRPLAADISLARALAFLAAGEHAGVPIGGTIYGVLHNDPKAMAALGERIDQPPYKAPPKAPVLYVKPRNTQMGHGAPIQVPTDAPALLMGGALGAVIGRTTCRIREEDALAMVAGYTVVNDVTVPHNSFYRPSIRHRVRDSFCPVGPWVCPAARVPDPDALSVRTWIDGVLVLDGSTNGFVRPLARLIAEISDFMTLQPGDLLITGVPFGAFGAPLARAGQRVAIDIEGVGRLENPLITEETLKGVSA
ncbi:fumarylacetoacetate hydrolase family protein [Ottowia thiooxydans]|uniref:fumarylacetoacetate hydrolase family protein n=1 Tax=Ottowia thiooxydans TaxID=219182 RepID=UPI000A059EC6|nr:fumarylacetoacetate hydrolase family protein [Ottowia thiooxydans]